MSSRFSNCFIGFFLLTVSIPANATLTGVQDYGTYFTDTQSGLDWLDVTESVNRSYNDVSSQFGSGGDFEGWRYATAAEFGTMWDNVTGESAGITGPGLISEYERGPVIDEVIDLFGDTLDAFYQHTYGNSYCTVNNSKCIDGDARQTRGLLSDTALGKRWSGYITDNDIVTDNPDRLQTTVLYSPNFSNYRIGSFLVRDASNVPVPSVNMLFAIGLVGIVFSKRKITNREPLA